MMLCLLLGACGDEQPQTAAGPKAATVAPARAATPVARWYGPEQVERGAVTYAARCASCHGASGEATPDWRQRDESGRFPPPPLDGSAHAWHHPVAALMYQIKNGAPGGKGTMPAFGDTLSDEQVLEVIAWFQDRWSDEIYAAWHDIELRSRSR